MKSVQQSLLERRTIRRYERMKVEPEKMQQIYDAIRNTGITAEFCYHPGLRAVDGHPGRAKCFGYGLYVRQ